VERASIPGPIIFSPQHVHCTLNREGFLPSRLTLRRLFFFCCLPSSGICTLVSASISSSDKWFACGSPVCQHWLNDRYAAVSRMLLILSRKPIFISYFNVCVLMFVTWFFILARVRAVKSSLQCATEIINLIDWCWLIDELNSLVFTYIFFIVSLLT